VEQEDKKMTEISGAISPERRSQKNSALDGAICFKNS